MKTKPEKASRFTLADNHAKEDNPQVLWPFRRANTSEMSYNPVSYLQADFIKNKEPLVRVFPQTGKDVAFLRMLEHRVDKFAPADGNGVIIKARLIQQP